MKLLWEFKSIEWDENSDCIEHTIAGKSFCALMELCFEQADYFSMGAAPWKNAKDSRLEQALQSFLIQEIRTETWFCYSGTEPPLLEKVYLATQDAKQALLQYINHLFLWSDDHSPVPTLEDLCFYQGDTLFFGTVTHERICYAHILTEQFGAQLKRLGQWDEGVENKLAELSLNKFRFSPYREITR